MRYAATSDTRHLVLASRGHVVPSVRCICVLHDHTRAACRLHRCATLRRPRDDVVVHTIDLLWPALSRWWQDEKLKQDCSSMHPWGFDRSPARSRPELAREQWVRHPPTSCSRLNAERDSLTVTGPQMVREFLKASSAAGSVHERQPTNHLTQAFIHTGWVSTPLTLRGSPRHLKQSACCLRALHCRHRLAQRSECCNERNVRVSACNVVAWGGWWPHEGALDARPQISRQQQQLARASPCHAFALRYSLRGVARLVYAHTSIHTQHVSACECCTLRRQPGGGTPRPSAPQARS
jgi:hypothetical protein